MSFLEDLGVVAFDHEEVVPVRDEGHAKFNSHSENNYKNYVNKSFFLDLFLEFS